MNPTNPELIENAAQSICYEMSLDFLGFIGSGAFKTVFKVRNLNSEILALKIIHSPGKSPRTEREIKALQDCKHPNVCKIIATGQYSSDKKVYDYSLEEFVSGGNLTEYVEKNGVLERSDALYLLETISSILDNLYSLQLVHRDIKPDNVLIKDSNNFEAILADFGLVRDLTADSLTQTWLMRGPGTPYYASPEQLNNEKEMIDWRSDQFSLGVLISCVFFGNHPFEVSGDTARDVVERVANRGPKSRDFLKFIETHNFQFLDRMTQLWPVQRYRLPSELISAIQKEKT